MRDRPGASPIGLSAEENRRYREESGVDCPDLDALISLMFSRWQPRLARQRVNSLYEDTPDGKADEAERKAAEHRALFDVRQPSPREAKAPRRSGRPAHGARYTYDEADKLLGERPDSEWFDA